MTKREFDAETKHNYGSRIARDERASYRAIRLLEHNGSGAHNPSYPYGPVDYLADRMRRMAELRRCGCAGITLGIGSPFRAPVAWRASQGKPLLAGRKFDARY